MLGHPPKSAYTLNPSLNPKAQSPKSLNPEPTDLSVVLWVDESFMSTLRFPRKIGEVGFWDAVGEFQV